MRSLVVAEAMQVEANYETVFVMNSGSDCEPVRRAGHELKLLSDRQTGFSPPFDWANPQDGPVFIDSYHVTETGLQAFEREGYCIAMFEDANRLQHYPCDVVIDPSPDADGLVYKGAQRTRFCLGPHYFPLRSEFTNVQRQKLVSKSVKQIVVTFGGSDPDDQALRLENILVSMKLDAAITIVLGPGYKGRAKGEGNIDLIRDAKTLAPVFSAADMVVSGGGGTALELAHLGLPMILIGLADNQIANAKAVDAAGAAKYMGLWTELSDTDITRAVCELMNKPKQRQAMSSSGQKLVDGQGGRRISKFIKQAWQRARSRKWDIP
jgi:UDP-2,4-diacetamido-2,4,6-trideoxy-beta-L-altropyranose hydrolase